MLYHTNWAAPSPATYSLSKKQELIYSSSTFILFVFNILKAVAGTSTEKGRQCGRGDYFHTGVGGFEEKEIIKKGK